MPYDATIKMPVTTGINKKGDNYPPNRFASSIASSREKLLSSPVKTKDKPARQFGEAGSGTCFEPGALGPAALAALEAAQLVDTH